MSSRRTLLQLISGEVPVLPANTFIGGVGSSTVTSAADYASKFNLSESDISNFQIDANNNVSMQIDVNYSTASSAFRNDTNLTYFIDNEGKLVNWYSFYTFAGCTNLKYFYAPAIKNGGFFGAQGQNLYNANKLVGLHLESINSSANFGRNFLGLNTSLRVLKLPNTPHLKMLGSSSYQILYVLSSIERIYIPLATEFSFYYATLPVRYFRNIKTGCKIFHNSAFGVMDRNAFNYFNATGGYAENDVIVINGLSYTAINGTPVNDGEFNMSGNQNSDAANLRNAINNDTRTGTLGKVTADASGTFIGVKTDVLGVLGNSTTIDTSGVAGGVTIYNNGNFVGGNDVHPVLAYVRDVRAAQLIEVSSPILVNSPSGLSASNQTSNSIDLNFTSGSVNSNGHDGLEVWVDDGTVYRKLFEHSEIQNSGDTVDLTDVVNDVGSLSGVKIKIRQMDGQMNFSEFSNEITLT